LLDPKLVDFESTVIHIGAYGPKCLNFFLYFKKAIKSISTHSGYPQLFNLKNNTITKAMRVKSEFDSLLILFS